MTDATLLHDINLTRDDALASKEGLSKDPRSIEDNSNLVPSTHDESSLPPVDGGKDAWLFLTACFVVEALVWGKTLHCFSCHRMLLIQPRLSLLLWYLPGVLLQP